jgi:hypothetical protein
MSYKKKKGNSLISEIDATEFSKIFKQRKNFQISESLVVFPNVYFDLKCCL